MAHDQGDIRGRQGLAERRHVAIEAPDRTTFVNDGLPVQVGFCRRERAVGEVWQRRVKPDGRDRRSLAIRSMAGQAGGAIHVRAGAIGGQRGWTALRGGSGLGL